MRKINAVAWGLWGAFVLALGVALYFGSNPPTGNPIRLIDAIWAASFIGFPTAGALIVPRMPRRPLGWILLVAPLLLMIGVGLSDAARHLSDTGSLTPWVLWIAGICFGAGLAPLLTVFLYLPDGRLPSPRWRRVGALVWSVVALSLFHSGFKPGPMEASSGTVRNPIGIVLLQPMFDAIEAALGPLLFLMIAIGVISLIIRYRGARGIARQQIKWLALGGVGVLAPFGSIAVIEAFFGDLGDVAVTLFIVVAILSLPTSIAIAVQKTRLYDVDIIINRALVYAVLTGILAAAYLALVVLLQGALEPVTRQSDLAVAGSTLAVAALFRPIRAWVQRFIDHRFYRRKYDAAETLGQFSAQLRDQVDLDSLSRELVGVVGRTMQPAHASLWLRTEVER